MLRAYLREKRLLLVLDNLEHLMEAAPEVSALLGSCPDLTVLITSRAPLRLRGEKGVPCASPKDARPLPRAGGRRDNRHACRPALRGARPGGLPTFELTEANAAAVAAICWRLDGLPLALELAAAGEVPRSYRASLALGSGTRGWRGTGPSCEAEDDAGDHGLELRAVAWAREELFRRLSVFSGGFTLEAAEAVGAEPGAPGAVAAEEVLLLLGNLVEQSLVVAKPGEDEDTRYRMLELVRRYALEKLEESGEAWNVHRGHAEFFLELAELAGRELYRPGSVMWLERLEQENDSLRAAMSWALSAGDHDTAARIGWELILVVPGPPTRGPPLDGGSTLEQRSHAGVCSGEGLVRRGQYGNGSGRLSASAAAARREPLFVPRT